MLLLMQHINPLTGVNVVQLVSWILLHRHFFWDEAPKSGKDGVERLFCPWLEIEMSPFGGKIVFFLGTSTDSSCYAKLKEITSGKMFDLINVFGETEMPKGQRICKVFGFEWRKTFCTPWSGLKLGENSRKIFFFICESVEDLVRWCYPNILSLLFQYTFWEW